MFDDEFEDGHFFDDDIEDIDEEDGSVFLETEEKKEVPITKYVCQNCQATFCSPVHEKVDRCIFCNQKNIEVSDSVENKTIYWIPFAKKEEEMLKDYRKKTFWNPLIPFLFKSKKTRQAIRKIYLSVFLANISYHGDIQFVASDAKEINENKVKKIENQKYEVDQNVHFEYKNVFLNTSSKIDSKIFDAIVDYNPDHLREGFPEEEKSFLYLEGDVLINEIAAKNREKVSKHALGIVRQNIKHSLKKLKQDNTVIQFENTKAIWVPVYYLMIRYRKKEYYYIMNGENGKSNMSIPVGLWETVVFSLLVCTIISVFSFFIARFL